MSRLFKTLNFSDVIVERTKRAREDRNLMKLQEFLTISKIRFSDVLSITITIRIMEELQLEPVDDSRVCAHTFNYSPSLKTTQVIHD